MNSIKQTMAGLALFSFLGLLVGCAEVIVPGAFTGGSEAYHYTTSNVVKKSLMGDAGQVKVATRAALKKMDVHFDSMKTEGNETEIEASTTELDITITIEPVTAATTKVKVDAVEDRVFKDKATAAQILSQIEAELNRKPPPKNSFPRVFIKNDFSVPSTLSFIIWTGKTAPPPGKPAAGSASIREKRSMSSTPTTAIFIFMAKRPPAGKTPGPVISPGGFSDFELANGPTGLTGNLFQCGLF